MITKKKQKKLLQEGNAYIDDLIAAGCEFTKTEVPVLDKNGNKVGVQQQTTVTKIPQNIKTILTFFTDAPCWFDGCEELRAQYKKELSSLKGGCTSCESKPIRRKFHKIVANAIAASNKTLEDTYANPGEAKTPSILKRASSWCKRILRRN